MTNVAINGLGRIGRATMKIILEDSRFNLVAVNDILSTANLAYLLKYDTVYGRWGKSVTAGDMELRIGGGSLPVLGERDPGRLPWRALGADLVFECTGLFSRREDLRKHIAAGARFVILSAPAKDEDIPTVVHGANTSTGGIEIISCASCTTNCITPVVEVLGRRIGIRKATMTTIHAYTSTQAIIDAGRAGDFRRGRAAAANLVPASTGAAIATTRALPEYKGKFNGAAVRVPVSVGSLADIVLLTQRETSVSEVNGVFNDEASSERYKHILGVSDEPIVSSDVIGQSYASIVDLTMTQVVDGDLVKIMSWYDNEWGYASQMVREAAALGG
ncbi:MAG TPA: type I glyceraldehyde-3-phosphate dehydrogenase [Bryobacteraceae bacterium]